MAVVAHCLRHAGPTLRLGECRPRVDPASFVLTQRLLKPRKLEAHHVAAIFADEIRALELMGAVAAAGVPGRNVLYGEVLLAADVAGHVAALVLDRLPQLVGRRV